MVLPRLIGFSGYAFAGKDTLADQFVERNHFTKTYMSKPLEKALLALDPYINVGGTVGRYSWLHKKVGYDKSKENPEVRRLLQILGTEIGREMFGQDAWLNLVFKEIEEEWSFGVNVCLTGVRYHNEMARVRDSGGVMVWVDRPGYRPVNSHSSDNTLTREDCDIQIINNSTERKMYDQLFPLLWGWGWKPRA